MRHALYLSYLAAAVLACTAASVWAQTAPTAKEARAAAKARLEADKKLCADESASAARMQCRRDAQTEYERALAAITATPAKPAASALQTTTSYCIDCGRVISVTVTDQPSDHNTVGMIAGGVAGALLGRQVGSGRGKDLATIAGAAGGAYAGKKIQENLNTTKVWTVRVEFGGAEPSNYGFSEDPHLVAGDVVQRSGNTIVRYVPPAAKTPPAKN
ncbi:glycine zipper 2TM domain-containing protein [Candidatus Symbiobacter mobilis]|uniref:Outer membrane lipoprotein-like protein n=1 Tax=Candidatus Symbiobacter mobilis CR TaxID=946483 RepID=U5NAC8_9BURK|nr:glycine zipper 2TM domain-containing protein [Candidatus Symbiobacter mobilis]AGX87149.1 outer membrane lipoprotein-like protein [Candidatus Symbiobacter mobilis CR]